MSEITCQGLTHISLHELGRVSSRATAMNINFEGKRILVTGAGQGTSFSFPPYSYHFVNLNFSMSIFHERILTL